MGSRFVLFVGAAFLCVAFILLYVPGVDFGRPHSLHPDEKFIVDTALKIAATGDYNPYILDYPSLPIYTQLVLSSFKHLSMVSNGEFINRNSGKPETRLISELTKRDTFEHYAVGRKMMVLLSAIALVFVFLIARRMVGPLPALFAVACTMFSPLYLEQARYVTPNMYITVFALAAVYFTIRFWDEGEVRNIYIAALCAGLGIGSKYPVAVILIPVLFAVAWKLRQNSPIHLLGVVAVTSFTFLITTPYAVLDLPLFLKDLGNVFFFYNEEGTHDATSNSAFARLLKTMWAAAPVLTIVGPLGLLALLFMKQRHSAIVLLLFVVPYLHLVLTSKAVFPRNLLPYFPFRAIGAAVVLALLWRFTAGKPNDTTNTVPRPWLGAISCTAFVLITLWGPTKLSIAVQKSFTAPTQFQEAENWIAANIPKGEKFVADSVSTCPPIPCPGGPYDVVVENGPYFRRPYVSHLDSRFVVSSGEAAFDDYAWRRNYAIALLARKTSPRSPDFVNAYLDQNRKLSDTRLASMKVLDAKPHGPTEVYLYGGVAIFTMPKVNVFKIETPSDPQLQMETGIRGLTGLLNQTIQLPAGEYDIFLTGMQVSGESGKFSATAPTATVKLGEKTLSVACPFIVETTYFVSSFSLVADAQLPLQIEVPPTLPISRIEFVRTGDPIPELVSNSANTPVFFGVNLLSNSNFDRGLKHWVVSGSDSSISVRSDDQGSQGLRSALVEFDADDNVGVPQYVSAIEADSEYLLIGHVAAKDVSGNAMLELQDGDAGWQSFTTRTQVVTGTVPWTRVSCKFQTPHHVKKLAVMLRRTPPQEAAQAGRGALWFDAIRLVKLNT